MRRISTSSTVAPNCRQLMNGFNMFVHKSQKEKGIFEATSLETGKKNMQTAAAHWRVLSKEQQIKYTEMARIRRMSCVGDPEKKNNAFNLIMRLFAEKKEMTFGDPAFVARVGSETAKALSKRDLARLQKRFNVEMPTDVAPPTMPPRRMLLPDMKYFGSFTEMQHSVAPTQKAVFVALNRSNLSKLEKRSAEAKFSKLTTEERLVFSPVLPQETAKFESFCANNSAGLNRKAFDIMLLLGAFRRIRQMPQPSTHKQELYKNLFSVERSHENMFIKTLRTLERLEVVRSSDCGMYISKHSPSSKVSSTAYAIRPDVDDVAISTMLAETRKNQSVYDDVLQRAAVLRSDASNKALELYRVPLEVPDVVTMTSSAVEKNILRAKKMRATATPISHSQKAKGKLKLTQSRKVKSRKLIKKAKLTTPKAETSKARTLSAKRVSVKKASSRKQPITEGFTGFKNILKIDNDKRIVQAISAENEFSDDAAYDDQEDIVDSPSDFVESIRSQIKDSI